MNTHDNGAIEKLDRILRYFLDLGPYVEQLGNFIPFFDQMISMIHYEQCSPSIAECPAIAQYIRQAGEEVSCHSKYPTRAVQEAAAMSAKALGW
jgi:hypothetical protein